MKKMLPAMAGVIFVLLTGSSLTRGQMAGIYPTAVTENFYDKYLALDVRGLPDKDQAWELSRFFSSQIKTLIKINRRKQEEFIKKHPDEKPPWIEGDLFTSSYEGATSFRVGKMRIKGATREVDVLLHHVSESDKVKWTDTVILKRENKKWVIANIIFKGKWQFKTGSSLLNALK